MEDDRVRERLNSVNIDKCMGPGRMDPQMLSELASFTVKPLLVIFRRSQ